MPWRLLFGFLVAAFVLTSGRVAAAGFPLKLSQDRRYLVDQADQSFLVVGDTAWSLIAQLTEVEVAQYLDDRARRGFTAILVNLIEHKFASKAPATITGEPPFQAPGDFSRPNRAYFDWAHRVVQMANQRGLSVWLCPAYLGWDGQDEGFFREIKVAGPLALRSYGQYVGARFKDLPNIVWMPGGDYAMPVTERWVGQELALGLREGGAEQLMTAHGGQTSALETFGDQAWLAVDSVYRYQEDLWRPLRETWRKPVVRPFVMLEAAYEGEHKATPDRIRRQAWWSMLSGACGQFFGNNPMWYFDGPGFTNSKAAPTWQLALDSTGARDIARLGAFFRQQTWWQLVPDVDDRIVSEGGGDGASRVVAAHSPDWRRAMLYLPSTGQDSRKFTLDLSAFRAPVTPLWFNPAKDAPVISPGVLLTNRSGVSLTAPGDNGTGANDWILQLEPADVSESLWRLAANVRPGFLLGAFASDLESTGREQAQLAAFFQRNFNILTIGVYMKATQPTPDRFSFAQTDALVSFAREHGLRVYLHPLIGGAEYTPDWVSERGDSTEAILEVMRDRIRTILTRYRGKVDYVDVVNEALTGKGRDVDGEFLWQQKAYRGPDHVWMKSLGYQAGMRHRYPRYLVEAFRTAREAAGPEVKLILNEWANETTRSLRGKAFLELVLALREDGVPVDAAGLQLHCRLKQGRLCGWASDEPFDFEAFAAMLRLYEQAGVDVHITEFDIHLEANPTERDYDLQGEYYGRVLRHALQSSAVKSFKTWGCSDRFSWKADGVDGHPLMLDEALRPKPAYYGMLETLRELGSARKNARH